MLTLRYNPATLRYDCYNGNEYVVTLTCGSRFNLYCDDEDVFVAGRIEHHNINGYYFICHEGYVTYLCNGMLGTLDWVSFILSIIDER